MGMNNLKVNLLLTLTPHWRPDEKKSLRANVIFGEAVWRFFKRKVRSGSSGKEKGLRSAQESGVQYVREWMDV